MNKTLNKTLNKVMTKRHHLIVDADNVTNILHVVNHYDDNEIVQAITQLEVKRCEWDLTKRKWYINFTTTAERWNCIRHDLDIVRVWEEKDIPTNIKGVIYTTD